MKKLRTILVIVAILGVMGFILARNKKEIDAKAQVKEEVKNIPVTVVQVALRNLSEDISVIGTFEPFREVQLLSEVQGKVVKVNVEKGNEVKEGTLLAQVDNELIRAELIAAEAAYEKAKKDVERYEALIKGNATTDVQVEGARLAYKNAEAQVKALNKRLRNTSITAPISGTVTTRSFEYGSVILPGNPLVQITDISKLKLTIQVPEKDVAKYQVGQTLAVQADVYPGVTFDGKVTMVGVKSDNAHNYPVEILVQNNTKNPLRAGMYGRAGLGYEVKGSALAIPRAALVGSIKNPQVYVVENGKAVLKNIQIGITSDQQIEVVDGLSAGEQVVVSGQINLENNTLVTVVK